MCVTIAAVLGKLCVCCNVVVVQEETSQVLSQLQDVEVRRRGAEENKAQATWTGSLGQGWATALLEGRARALMVQL